MEKELATETWGLTKRSKENVLAVDRVGLALRAFASAIK